MTMIYGSGQAALKAAGVEAKAQSARLRGNGFASLETFPFQNTCMFSIRFLSVSVGKDRKFSGLGMGF